MAIQFYRSKTLKNHLADILSFHLADILSSKVSVSKLDAALSRLAREYYDVFTHAIFIDPYYGSCFVALPRGAELDLEAVCGEAGYVYMCGRCLYMRKTQKCSIADLKRNIIDYFSEKQDYRPKSSPLPFRIFSRFLFPDTSQHLRKYTQHGIADFKIDPNKYSFGGKAIDEFLQALEEDPVISKLLTFPPDVRLPDNQSSPSFPDKTLWLATERAFKDNSRYPDEQRYFVSFAQDYINKSEFYIFDERAPGWSSPITLPHSLASAMLNLARPFAKEKDHIAPPSTLIEPFVGSGTIVLQALKFHHLLTLTCNDHNTMTHELISENLRFFCLQPDILHSIQSDVQMIHDELVERNKKAEDDSTWYGVLFHIIHRSPELLSRGDTHPQLQDLPPIFTSLAHVLQDVMKELGAYRVGDTDRDQYEKIRRLLSHDFTPELLNKLRQYETPIKRLLFFLLWRSLIKNVIAIYRATEATEEFGELERYFIEESAEFLDELKRLIVLRKRDVVHERDAYFVRKDEFGLCTSANTTVLKKAISELGEAIVVQTQDAKQLFEGQPGNFYDLIVTDPPYGINAPLPSGHGPPGDIQELYRETIGNMVHYLADNGQLVLCLADRVYHGQSMPRFLTEAFVKQQLLIACGDDIAVVDPNYDVPSGIPRRDQYYWESAALKRKILHFQIAWTALKSRPPETQALPVSKQRSRTRRKAGV